MSQEKLTIKLKRSLIRGSNKRVALYILLFPDHLPSYERLHRCKTTMVRGSYLQYPLPLPARRREHGALSDPICLFSIPVFTFHPEKFVLVLEAVVVPLLPQRDLEAVLLQNETERGNGNGYFEVYCSIGHSHGQLLSRMYRHPRKGKG